MSAPTSTHPVAAFRDVRFAYSASARRGEPFRVVGLDVEVARGEILGVIGPNSAGKTTLVRLLTRVLTPDRGRIEIDGLEIGTLDGRELARRVAVVPQHLPHGFPFTVEQLVLMGRYAHGAGRFFETAGDRAVAGDAMAAVGVRHLARVPLDELAGGERQRAVLARALAQSPQLLVLDEPTAHLDLNHQAAAAVLLRRRAAQGLAVVLVSHDLNLAAALADRLLLLVDGRVAALGAPDEVLDAGRLERVFGTRVVVERSATTGRPIVQLAWDAGTIHEGR